jgi:glc operon protein GlcG
MDAGVDPGTIQPVTTKKETKMQITLKRFALAAAALMVLAVPAGAQVAEKKSLTLDGARQVIAAAKAEAKRLNAPGGVIAVVDDGGNLMALERLDGTFAAGANISIGKARTAVLFKRPTRFFEELINSSGKGRTVMTALNDFTPLIGGVPVTVDGQVVGGVGVSGAASAQQDEELAIAGANALASSMGMMTMLPVSYFDAKQVAAAFAKGAVLVGEDAGRNYMVHASRRDGPGMAEVHEQDTDIIYVLEGSATFVTGGTVAKPKTVAPGEIRGASIANGETRQLVKGDVVIVPNGTPHWFQQVNAPLTYYVVKVR